METDNVFSSMDRADVIELLKGCPVVADCSSLFKGVPFQEIGLSPFENSSP